MSKSRIGIYSPTWNTANYVGEMIKSIQEQTHQNWVLAILDDASDDNSYEAAKKAAEGDSRIIVKKRDQHDGRIGYIKNENIKLLGDVDYLASVDSDDLITPEAIKLFADFLDNNPDVGAACGNFTCFDDNGKRWAFPHVANSGEFNSDVLLKYMCYFPMRFVRKEHFDSVGGYDNELTSAIDYDLALKLDEVCTIKRIKDPVTYLYRQHSIQVSTRERPEQDLNAKKALEKAVSRRNLNVEVVGNKPPFSFKNQQSHFIWGKQ